MFFHHGEKDYLNQSLRQPQCQYLIITTNVPGCNDIIEHRYSGLLVDVKNKDMIREAIKIFLEDPKTAENLANNARKTVVKNSN